MSRMLLIGVSLTFFFFPLQASALVQTQDEKKINLLYHFLSNASEIFVEVFPLM